MGTKTNKVKAMGMVGKPSKQREKPKSKPLKDLKKKSEERQKREIIKNDLVEELRSLGKFSKYHEDLIEDYLFYWDLKNKMQRNIKNSGLMITQITGNGFPKRIVNPNVKESREVNSTMLRILKELDIQQSDRGPIDEDGFNGKYDKL